MARKKRRGGIRAERAGLKRIGKNQKRGQLFDIKIQQSKKFQPQVPNQRKVLNQIGRLAGIMIRKRIAKGFHAEGRLPEVSYGFFFTSRSDPRFNYMDQYWVPRFAKGETGPKGSGSLRIYAEGYEDYKRKHGKGGTRRGQSLTGKMWRSLAVALFTRGRKNRKRAEIVVGFAGQVATSVIKPKTGKVQRVSIRNRKKATLLQYGHRRGGEAAGPRQFELMGMTDGEVNKLARLYASKIRMFTG